MLYKKTFIINVQADQPLITSSLLKDCLSQISMNQSCQIITPIYPLKTEEIHDPNIVKALFKKNNEAIYF